MGCTSGKAIKKRTTSVEDVATAQKASTNASAPSPSENGQVPQTKTPTKNKTDPASTAIQIPGTHKSFMAPDGIPFIDEDVDSEGEQADSELRTQRQSPDQNKNVVGGGGSQQQQEAKSSSSALREGGPSERSRGGVEGAPGAGEGSGGEQRPVVVGQILEVESRHTAAVQHSSENADSHASRTAAEAGSTDEDTARQDLEAAIRIQAGVRGFLDRQKVKSIRANQQQAGGNHIENDVQVNHSESYEMSDRSVLTDEHVEVRSPEKDDPQLNKAAIKIQANYKGYKTRKNLKGGGDE